LDTISRGRVKSMVPKSVWWPLPITSGRLNGRQLVQGEDNLPGVKPALFADERPPSMYVGFAQGSAISVVW
jgi:hypothetical protein